jgi:hypothetical protein
MGAPPPDADASAPGAISDSGPTLEEGGALSWLSSHPSAAEHMRD